MNRQIDMFQDVAHFYLQYLNVVGMCFLNENF